MGIWGEVYVEKGTSQLVGPAGISGGTLLVGELSLAGVGGLRYQSVSS